MFIKVAACFLEKNSRYKCESGGPSVGSLLLAEWRRTGRGQCYHLQEADVWLVAASQCFRAFR